MKSFLREFLITFILAVVIFFVIQATIQSFIVVGVSMVPSFANGQRLLVNKAAYYFHEPERGDVIVLKPFDNQTVDYIKRIIALPSDTIEIKSGTVYVNGRQLSEPYINFKDPASYNLAKKTIPAEEYFVLGDNRGNSNDSHSGWLVSRENIIGKAWVSIWPPDRWGLAPNYPLQEQVANAMAN